MTELRMNAYYYSFDGTGEPVIDRILSAVACAGKAEHHTTYWTDEHEAYEGHEGDTCVAWIQNAAVDAAAEIASLRQAPCQHPEEERDEIADIGRKHEWCGDCGAMRNIVYVSQRDGTQTEEWSDWRAPTRVR